MVVVSRREKERKRVRERSFGEAGMAQIVVYNRTGIETRFVAFRLLAGFGTTSCEKERQELRESLTYSIIRGDVT